MNHAPTVYALVRWWIIFRHRLIKDEEIILNSIHCNPTLILFSFSALSHLFQAKLQYGMERCRQCLVRCAACCRLPCIFRPIRCMPILQARTFLCAVVLRGCVPRGLMQYPSCVKRLVANGLGRGWAIFWMFLPPILSLLSADFPCFWRVVFLCFLLLSSRFFLFSHNGNVFVHQHFPTHAFFQIF